MQSNIPFRFFDGDGSAGSPTFRYGVYDEYTGELRKEQPPHGVTPLFLHGHPDTANEAFIEALFEEPGAVKLFDLGAGWQSTLGRTANEYRLGEKLDQHGIDLTIVTCVEPTVESVPNLRQSLEQFPAARHAFLFSEKLGGRNDGGYIIYDGDPLEGIPVSRAKQGLAALGERGSEIVLPKLDPKPLVLASHLMIPFGAAMYDKRIRMANRLKIEAWLYRAEAGMAPADHFLGLKRNERPLVILVVSDKGGVGKSTFASLLWERMLRLGYGVTYGPASVTAGEA